VGETHWEDFPVAIKKNKKNISNKAEATDLVIHQTSTRSRELKVFFMIFMGGGACNL
jgi:hypothetical protein